MNTALTALGTALVGGLVGGALVLTLVDAPAGPAGPAGPQGKPGAASPALKGTHVLADVRNGCPKTTLLVNGEVTVTSGNDGRQTIYLLCRVR